MPTKLLWRLPGVLLAAISLVMLMTPAFGIQFKPWFVEFLKELEDWEVTLFFQFITPHVEAVIDYLNTTFDWHLKVADWWHHAFVLLWLLHGSWARNLSRGQGWGYLLCLLIWGGVTALVAGVATGTAPLNSAALLLWPFAGFAAFATGNLSWEAVRVRAPRSPPLMYAALATLLAYLGYAFTEPWTSLFETVVPSPGLLDLAGIIGITGLGFILIGLLRTERDSAHIDNELTSLGFEIIGAFGLAATLAVAGQYL